MAIKINQGFEYKWSDWWEWWIWIDGSKAELDQIDHVIYKLHPTFPNPIRTIRTRSTNFLLKTSGWGGFRIYAKVLKKDGSEIRLTHDLVLEHPSVIKTLR